MKKMSTILVVCALMFGLGFMGLNVTSCGSNSSTVTDDGDDAAKVAATTMGSAVPSEVVISSPTAELSEATLSLTKEVIAAEPGSDYMTKKQEFVALVAGEGECTFTLGIPTITPPDCYGPTVSYENHPDGGGGPNNEFPPYDLGFWNETEGDEACSAAKTNDVVSNIAARVDNMIKIMGAMACAGNKAGVDLPGVGEELDLTSTIADQVSVTGLAVSSAILERLADSDTNEVYRSTLSVATTIDENVETNTLVLTHIKTSEDGSTYQGKLRFKMSDEDGNCEVDMGQEGDPTPPDGMSYAGTILYEKSSAELLKYEVNYAMFCGADTDPFDVDGDIDPADLYGAENLDGWSHDWNYGLFNIDPTDGSGSLAYAWQAGGADNWTRVLNVSTVAADDGSATGNAYYGYGPHIADGGAGTIEGMICNWAGPNPTFGPGNDFHDQVPQKVQWQSLVRGANAALFTVSEQAITYAPTNSCNSTGEGFTYKSEIGTMSNDNPGGDAVTSDLVDLAEIEFTAPTAPSDI